ncbi:hypothetical protein [Bacillus atrophaeus]|uniref:hypothetical protein n=1 Tax=Bacillus atrophaeus TaxID=1452 RepID=UPI001BA4F18D|nr:hypothetical protein [Bacillus atrophaeus]QUF66009.1 hypothetical protein KCX77_03410 [Bacillus atrophaeus]QUF66062.1 hypothetical protein KCX77_03710 [Bacillus atrophaeus]
MPNEQPTMLETLLGSVCEGYETGTFTTATTGGVAAAILVYRLFNNQQQDNFRAMTEELCSRIQKIIHLEIFNQNKNELDGLRDGLRNYGSHGNYDLLDELELKSLDLYRKFEEEESVEGVSCAVAAFTVHMAVLQAFYNLTPQFEMYRGYKQTIIEKSREFTEFMESKMTFLLVSVEKSIDPSSVIHQSFKCVPYKGNNDFGRSDGCSSYERGYIKYFGGIRDHFADGAFIYSANFEKEEVPLDIAWESELDDLKRLYPNTGQQIAEKIRQEKLLPRREFTAQLTNSMQKSINFFKEVEKFL